MTIDTKADSYTDFAISTLRTLKRIRVRLRDNGDGGPAEVTVAPVTATVRHITSDKISMTIDTKAVKGGLLI